MVLVPAELSAWKMEVFVSFHEAFPRVRLELPESVTLPPAVIAVIPETERAASPERLRAV